MSAVSFQLAQGDIKSISNPARITAVGGDNGTEFFINLPYMPPGSQWVFPFTYGWMYTIDSPTYSAVLLDASKTPPGASATPTTSKIARLAAYDTNQVFNPGISASGSTIQRWNVLNQPATGAQATASKVAVPGVTHIADSFIVSAISATAAPGVVAVVLNVIDGLSGGSSILATFVLGCPAAAGGGAPFGLGPGLNFRGSPGNAMTIEFTAGVANVVEAVSLSGFDQ